MSSIKIILDSGNEACYPGQTIAGRLQCRFEGETSFKAIRIKFRGRAKTKWNETETYTEQNSNNESVTKTRTVTFTAEENYFNAEYKLVEGGDSTTLPSGNYSYPFSYILPPELPSPFEGEYGHIRYSIKASVDRPWKFDFEDQLSLRLISPLDLNPMSGLREPVALSEDKTFCSCWCNNSGALTFNVSLPVTGFVPGQAVNVGCHVENMTNVSAEQVKFKIEARLKYISHHPSRQFKYENYMLAGQIDGGIGAHGDKSWTSVLNILPNKPAPNLIPCNIINIKYRLKGEVVVPCPHKNLNLEIPVMIGTVPLSGVSTTFSAAPPSGMPLPRETTPLLRPYPAAEGLAPSYVANEKVPSAPPESVDLGPSAPPLNSNGASYAGGSVPYPPGAPPLGFEKSKDEDFDFELPSYDDVKEMKDKK